MKWFLLGGGITIGLLLYSWTIAANPQDSAAKERRAIPLTEIVTTSPQKGLQSVRDVLQQNKNARQPDAADGYLRQLLSGSNGSSNVFLVDAPNIYGALSASFSILVGGRSADTPALVNTPDPPHGGHWLVAYLGAGPSNPTWWTLESVSVEKGKVILSYRPSKPSAATDDVHQYYYWIPLGKLDSGVYELQLVDADKAAITLMRRVEVTRDKK